MNMVTVSDI